MGSVFVHKGNSLANLPIVLILFMKIKYYSFVMTQQSMLCNHILEEILRERAHNYLSRKKPLDFWLILAPTFLSQLEIQQKTKYIRIEDYCSLISLDMDFLHWVQLRLGSSESLLCSESSDGSFLFDKIEESPNSHDLCAKKYARWMGSFIDRDPFSLDTNINPLLTRM